MDKKICPSCYALLQPDSIECPACHASVDPMPGGSNDLELLTKTLRDSRGEVRSNAIFALGRRRDKLAADALVACALRHPADVDEGLQIVGALATLAAGKPHSTALHYLIARHPNSAVKHAASLVLGGE